MLDIPSTNLSAVGYDKESQTLDVRFDWHGEVYRFFSISEEVYQEFLIGKPTPGKWFYHHIRIAYPFVRIR